MKLAFILKWCEAKDEWHLLDHDGNFVYELRDCKNMNRLFDMPDKGKKEYFVIDVHRLATKERTTWQNAQKA